MSASTMEASPLLFDEMIRSRHLLTEDAQARLLEEENGTTIVTSTDSDIVRETLRIYGTLYAVSVLAYCLARRRYPRLFNVRSWARADRSKLAQQLEYGWFDWMWRVFANCTEDQLVDECGLDAVCFLRALRFGRRLCYLGMLQAVCLIPLYRTAPESGETAYLQDGLVLISIANVPASSPRFVGTVLSAYVTYLCAMHLIYREFQWFTARRHEFLSRREPRNYAVHVSGIPRAYRSGHQLENYFRQCGSGDAVLEAHVCREAPRLDGLVQRRARVIASLEHAAAAERRTGRTVRHTEIRWRSAVGADGAGEAVRSPPPERDGGGSNSSARVVERVDTVSTLQRELRALNRDIQRRVSEVTSQSSRRGGLSRSEAKVDLLQAIQEDVDEDEKGDPSSESGALIGNVPRALLARLRSDATAPARPGTTKLRRFFSLDAAALPRQARPRFFSRNDDDDDDGTADAPSSPALVSPDNVKWTLSDDVGKDDLNDPSQQEQQPCFSAYFLKKEGEEKKSTDELDRSHNSTYSQHPPDMITDTITNEDGDVGAANDDTEKNERSIRSDGAQAENLDKFDPALELIEAMIDPFLPSPPRSTSNRFLFPGTDELESPRAQPESGQTSVLSGNDTIEIAESIPEDESFPDEHENFDTIANRWMGRNEVMMQGDVEEGALTDLYPLNAWTEHSSSLRSVEETPPRHHGDSALSSRSGWSTNTSSKQSSGGSIQSRMSSSRQALPQTIRRSVAIGSPTVNRAGTLRHGSRAAGLSLARGSQAAGSSIAKKSQAVGSSIAKGSQAASGAMGSSAEWLIQNVGEKGNEALLIASKVGTNIISTAGAVVPALLLNKEEGKARDAGFVVFNNLYAVQTALQMIHHPKPYVMDVTPAGSPKSIFWRNVGLPHRAKRGGRLASFTASAVLCFFWSVPMAFVSSLTEVNSLKESLPRLGEWIEEFPWLENVLAQVAPMLLLFFNEGILPVILKYFGTWEGHINNGLLEASLFTKMGCFMIIQTFFVSALSGGITAEITNILENPGSVIDLLANALPSQGYYFVQIALAQTFFLQAIETLRLYPLGLALLRRCIGPRLTAKERRKSFGYLRSLDEPPDFWHAETFAQLILFYMVYFVYAPITPIMPVFLCFCFFLCESGYRYQFIHNYPLAFETGGVLWKSFIKFILASMVIAQLTLIGLLALKKSEATPALIPLLVITVLFIIFINSKHSHVSNFLPTRDCILIDSENRVEGEMDMDFVRGAYLQPSLQNPIMEPDFDEGKDDYVS